MGIMDRQEPQSLYMLRRGSPLVLGRAPHGLLFASDVQALAPHCQEVLFPQEGWILRLSPGELQVWDEAGKALSPPFQALKAKAQDSSKGRHAHHMHKEIHQQPQVLEELLQNYPRSMEKSLPQELQKKIDRLYLVACGSTYLAALLARYSLEELLPIPIQVETN